jgi:hypothetical protein
MKNASRHIAAVVLLAAGICGCTSYTWKSSVPEEYRTVAVPTFENRTDVAELGPATTQYTRREFQREGTFALKRTGDAAIEIQGVIVTAHRGALTYDRSLGTRANSYRYVVTAEISVIDKKNGKVLLDNRKYTAETTFLTQNDLLTGQRNAAARIGQDLGRQIVDDMTAWSFGKGPAKDRKAAPRKK